MKIRQKNGAYGAAVIGSSVGLSLAIAAGCSSGETGSGEISPSETPAQVTSVGTAYADLVSDVLACQSDARACASAAGTDPTKLGACATGYRTCTDNANAADAALAKAIGGCNDAFVQCRASGGSNCDATLRSCLGALAPADAGVPQVPQLPPGVPSGLPSGLPPLPSGLPGLPPLPAGLPSGLPPLPSGLPSGFPPLPSGLPSGLPPLPSGLPPLPTGLPSGLPPLPSGLPPLPTGFPMPPPNPGRACFDGLTQCVQAGGQVQSCVASARQCLVSGFSGDGGTP